MNSDYHLLKNGDASGIQINTGDDDSIHRSSIISSNNANDLRIAPPQGDEESQTRKDLKQVKETCTDFLHNPFEFGSLLFFFLAAIFGVAVFIIRFVGMDNLDVYTCIILFLVGCLAAFEYRVYGGMFHQIRVLGGMVDEFEETSGQIKLQVQGINGENEELQQNIDNLKGKSDDLKKVQEELSQRNDELGVQSKELQEVNEKMKSDVENLEKEQLNLDQSAQNLTSACDGLKNQIDKFGDIKDELSRIAENSNLDIMEFVNTMNSSYAKWDKLLYENELTLLRTRADKMEMRDAELGLSKMEWVRFERSLPSRYRKIVKEEGIKFATLAGDNLLIDPPELTALIDRLIKKNLERQKEEN